MMLDPKDRFDPLNYIIFDEVTKDENEDDYFDEDFNEHDFQ